MHVLLTLTLSAAVAAASVARPLTYTVQMSEPEAAAEDAVVLDVRRLDGDGGFQRQISVPSTGTLGVVEGTWEFRLVSEKLWAPTVSAAAGEEVVLRAQPAGRLRAKVLLPAAGAGELKVILTPANPSFRGVNQRAEVLCPLNEGRVDCTVPAGLWDARLLVPGLVPEFRWGVNVKAGRTTDLGSIRFLQGAAVIGTVTRAGITAELPKDTMVTLVPAGAPAHDAKGASRAIPAGDKGFFRFVDVSPGEYLVTASGKSLASDTVHIRVIANRSAELIDPLILDTPKTARLAITPALDPALKPWTVTVARKRAGADSYETVAQSAAAPDGRWEQGGLRDGEYSLTVGRDDSEWAATPFTVRGSDVELSVTVPAAVVHGTVTFGDQPIVAEVTFGGEHGARRETLRTNADGDYAGVVPEASDDRWDVFVEADTPPLRRTLLDVRGVTAEDGTVRVDLQIPRTAVLGVAVAADGKPVAGAIVTFKGVEGRDFDQVFAAEDGTFQISGLAAGTYAVTADAFMLSSETTRFTLTDNESPALRLVLQPVQQVKGRVISRTGVPVYGADILALPRNTTTVLSFSERSADNGVFVLRVPKGVSILDVLVISPGFSTVMARVPVEPDRLMEVITDQNGGTLVATLTGDGTLSHAGAVWSLTWAAQRSGGTRSNEGGRTRITVPGLEPGEYTVCSGGRCASGHVPANGEARIVVD